MLHVVLDSWRTPRIIPIPLDFGCLIGEARRRWCGLSVEYPRMEESQAISIPNPDGSLLLHLWSSVWKSNLYFVATLLAESALRTTLLIPLPLTSRLP